MEDLQQLLDRMFRTRTCKSFTHHEGHQGVITIRFIGLGGHLGKQPTQQSELSDSDQATANYHATFKLKSNYHMNRDRNRSVGNIRHYNTRSKNTKELPRHSDYYQDNFVYSNLSPFASIFTPSQVDPVAKSDVFVSPSLVCDMGQNSESSFALLSDSLVSDSQQNIICEENPSEALSSPADMPEITPVPVDMPEIPLDPVNIPTEISGAVRSEQIPKAINYSAGLKGRRERGLAAPVKPRRKTVSIAVSPVKPQRVKRRPPGHPTPEHKFVKCHLCKRDFDALEQGCCYFDHLRLKDLLYFCRELCMNCYRDSDNAVT